MNKQYESEFSDVAASAVEDALRAFAKAQRAIQLYLPNSPTRANALEQTRAAFVAVWEHTPTIKLDVSDSTLLWDARVVYQDLERGSEGLPWLLHRDGLRSLTLQAGFETSELERLLTILQRARSASPDEDDLVTLLWVADFTFVEYFHIEIGDMVEFGQPLAEHSGRRAGVPRGTASSGVASDEAEGVGGYAGFGYAGFGYADIGDASATDTGVDGANVADGGTSSGASGGASGPSIVRMENFDSSLYFLDRKEIAYLEEELKREYSEDHRRQAFAILFDIVELPEASGGALRALEAIDQLLLECLSAGDFEQVGYVLRESQATLRRGDHSDEVASALRELPSRLSEPAAMAQLLQALDEGVRTPTASLLESLFGELRPAALMPLVSWLGAATASPARAAIERASLSLARAHTGELARLLEHEDAAIVRGAVRVAATLATPAAVPGLSRVLRGDDAKMRTEAVSALADIGSPGALQALERAIDDQDRDVRVATFRAIAARRHAGALPRLAQALRRKELRTSDLGEKMALFEAYGTLCGDAGVAELDGILNARGLLGAKEPVDMRACAARALGLIGLPAAIDALERSADTKEVVVRSAVTRALRGGT